MKRLTRSALGIIALPLILSCPIATEIVDEGPVPTPLVKNIILMISDGTANGSWDAADLFENGAIHSQAREAFPVKLGVSTFPLNQSTTHTGNQTELCGYDPAKAWDESAAAGKPWTGYNYLASGFTDSAAAATAMATGTKTYLGAINIDNQGRALTFITHQARRAGKATGTVTTVNFNHATPAAFGAWSAARGNYNSIAHQMLFGGNLDLVMGAGHPAYGSNGEARTPITTWISSADWKAATGDREFFDAKADFEALAAAMASTGTLDSVNPLFAVARAANTLQEERTLAVQGADSAEPSGIARLTTVPDLATMAKGALNRLGEDKDGLFLMVEGGAVDWAAASNSGGKLVEEVADFNAAVDTVVDWIEANSSWDETLLIVTADHGTGLVYGGNGAFQALSTSEAGTMPTFSFFTTTHTNELVRLWAKGALSAYLAAGTVHYDSTFAARTGHNVDGAWIDNTDIHRTMAAALGY